MALQGESVWLKWGRSSYPMPVTIFRGGETDAFLTTEALRVVLQEEQPAALSEVLREMERARMMAEDWRGAMESPYGNRVDTRDPNHRMLSWREIGQERNETCDYLATVNAEAREALVEARGEIRVALDDPGSDRRAALTAAYNAMREAETTLNDDEPTSSSDEEDTDELEEDTDDFEGVDIDPLSAT